MRKVIADEWMTLYGLDGVVHARGRPTVTCADMNKMAPRLCLGAHYFS
jgi:hypothetical protein